jgi:hypothetical protein
MEKLLLEVRAMRANVVKNKRLFQKDDKIFEELAELSLAQATGYFRRILGHTPEDKCGCSPVKQLSPKDDYFTFPINSPYGLNDCKEVVLGGKYTVDADSIKAGIMKLKPVEKSAKAPKDATPTA